MSLHALQVPLCNIYDFILWEMEYNTRSNVYYGVKNNQLHIVIAPSSPKGFTTHRSVDGGSGDIL